MPIAAARAPGAYYETFDAGGPEVTPLRTDIAGFVGICERGPLDLPVPVRSWRQFASWFGEPFRGGFLAYAVRGFFENGGARCWVVRVASADPVAGAACAAVDLTRWRVRASTEGAWGNRLQISVRETERSRTSGTGGADGRSVTVSSTGGFTRHTHVRITRQGRPPVWAVVAGADVASSRLSWAAPVAGIDPGEPVTVAAIVYDLLVWADGRPVGRYPGLSLAPGADGYGPRVLGATGMPVDPVTRQAAWQPPEPVTVEDLQPGLGGLAVDPDVRLALSGGRSGLAELRPADYTGGLRALERISEVSLLAVPDALARPRHANLVVPGPAPAPDPCGCVPAGPATAPAPVDADEPPAFGDHDVFHIQAAAVEQCERLRYRFALLDPPYRAATDPAGGLRAALDWRARFDTSYAALAHPWLAVADPAGRRLVPPSGHLAGVYAATDLRSGVHRAAANVPVSGALATSTTVGEQEHALLNEAGVTAIRTVRGGPRVLGARTLSSDPDRRFVPVRRLLAMIEKALEISLQWAAFEPDGTLTRARAAMSVTAFLLGLHEDGMLAGATPAESFFVSCDDEINPPESVALGRLIIQVGVAPVLPFEFVMLRVGAVRGSLDVREAVSRA